MNTTRSNAAWPCIAPLLAAAMSLSLQHLCWAQAAAGDHAKEPGRRVKVAAIAIGRGGPRDQKLKLALEHLSVAGRHGVDIACLPEVFIGEDMEPVPGPTTRAVAALAKQYHMYVVCPIRERGDDGRQYNTAVLLDRNGQVAGRYRKIFVFWTETNVHPGESDLPVFDTDFGRVAMLTCFDANFDEVWQQAERKGAEMILWPSAYGGGLPLNGYAMIHNYYVVAVGRGNMIDSLGRTIAPEERPLPQQFISTLDLDVTPIHKDFNAERIGKLLAEQKGKIELLPDVGDMEGWYVLRAVAPGVRVRDLCKQYGIETLREYRHRSRDQINEFRRSGEPVSVLHTQDGKPPCIVFIAYEEEYHAAETLPRFAHALSSRFGCRTIVLRGDENKGIAGLEQLAAADTMVLFMRRHALPKSQMALIRRYLERGGPLVALRTSSHAFDIKKAPPEGFEVWPEFDHQVLGGNYHDHWPHGSTIITPTDKAQHPILAGIDLHDWVTSSSLYRTSPVSAGATVLLQGSNSKDTEPVAWTSTYRGGRVFYAALGNVDDFQSPRFNNMLTNAIYWSMNKPVPVVLR
jgi:type 1 glutamine amidotransferase